MSIPGKHSYRFGYLKSEAWQTVRIAALAREHGRCQICHEESIHNDAHHLWYPSNIWETRQEQLVILCRACHEFIHAMRPECKTRDEEKAKADWVMFKNAIVVWRRDKIRLFAEADEKTHPILPKDLRSEYKKKTEALRVANDRIRLLEASLASHGLLPIASVPEAKEPHPQAILSTIKQWSDFYEKHKEATQPK